MIDKTIEYCKGILMSMECLRYPYHNLAHTQEVVANVTIVSKDLYFSKEEIEMVQIAAWLHDIGYSRGYRNHEEASKQIANQFLNKENLGQEKINLICAMIEATKTPQRSKNIYEKVLCDADLFHIGSSDFFYRKLLLREEWEQYHNVILSNKEWYELNLEFLKNHQFKTEFGKSILEKGKQRNISKIVELLCYC